jgi:hypothetical protein
MIVIYVKKEWLETIGEAADLLLIRAEQNNYVSILAWGVVRGFPFVEARLASKSAMESGEYLVPSSIPTHLVSGIFDLTAGEAERLGFHQPKKRDPETIPIPPTA